MKSKQGKYSGQGKSRFNRFYNSDNRRNDSNSNQAFNNLSNFNQNVFDILNPQALPNMYQRNNFRSFNNTQPYGNAPYQQQGSQSIHVDMCNVQDHFRSHANQGFNKVIPQMNFHSPPSDFGMSQYGPMHNNNNNNNNTHQGHASQSHSNSQRMNYSTSSNTGKSNQVEIFGKSPVKNQRCQESSDNSQTNKMCEVFNDVLGEKPPESSSSKSGQSNPVPYGNNLSPFNSQNGNKMRNHRSRFRINYNKRGNPDPNWEPNKDCYQKSRERCARQDVDDRYDEDRRNLSSDSTKSRQKKLEDSRKSLDSSVSTEKISSKESKEPSNQVLSDKNKPETKKSNITYSTRSSKISSSNTTTNLPSETKNSTSNIPSETNNSTTNKPSDTKNSTTNKPSDTKNSTTNKPSDTKNGTTNKPGDTKNSTTNKPSDTKNGTTNKPGDTKNSSNSTTASKNNDSSTKNITHTDKDKNKEKESTKEKTGEKTEKKTSSVSKKRQRFPSSSSSGSDTDCMIEETKTPEKVSGVQKESLEKVKTKTKAIMRSTSSATARPSQSSNLGKVTKDSPVEKKKKKKDSTPLEDTSPISTTIINLTSPISTTINLTSPSSTAMVSSAASTTTITNTMAPSLIAKKTLSIGDAQKLMKPRTRKDAHRADQFVKEFWEKRDRPQAASGSNPSSANQPSDPSFNIDHLDLATLDFKDLKSDIPKELSDVINEVFDFSSTEKNPIILDDEVESSKKTFSDDTSKRKRKNSEPPVPRKRTKEGDKMSSKPAEVTAKKSKHNNTEQSDVEDANVVATSDANAPSLSPAASNLSPGHPSSSSPQPGILQILLQLQLKEDEMHEHISNMDDEIQNIQAMIVDLSHKLTSKKHHRDMMINEEKRLKAFRIQALRGWWSVKTPTDLPLGSVDSNKASPDLHQQFLDCISTTQPSNETHPPEEENFTADGQVIDKVINIVPQTDDDQSNILQGINFVPPYQSARPLMSPSRPILSPPPRSMDSQSGSVRYLGILNDLSYLFKRPANANDSNSASRHEVQSSNNTSTKSAEPSELDISKVKSEFAGKN